MSLKLFLGVYFFLLAFACFGCEQPESFLPSPDVQCIVTNPYSSTLNYACEDGTYRCTNVDGSVKYKNCWYGDAYCVEVCR